MFQNFSTNDAAISAVGEAGELLADCLARGGKVMTCGNGGSMCDAMHLAEELSGRFRADRRALAALALSDVGHLTCVGNDFGFDEVFSRGVEALGRPGDVLVVFTTSGTSKNIVRAAQAAEAGDLRVVAVTGHAGRAIEGHATITIVTPGGRWADRVQELHSLVIHTLIEIVEHALDIESAP
jgi:D-sedoheptulose 7-phosphate isomerase